MNCLHPRYIRVDKRSSVSAIYTESPRYKQYRDVRPSLNDYTPVPCGKCIACLKNRQNALVSRCLEESEKRGSFCFLTLTYDEEHLPIAQSLWRVSKDTGEYQLVERGEVIVSARNERLSGKLLDFKDDILRIRKYFNDNACKPSIHPRYVEHEIPGFEDADYVYVARLTPSVCREDVRLWLKRARVRFEREHGYKLPDFSYVMVQEYGPSTCRPHYHLAFFGLQLNEAIWLSDTWSYGYRMLKQVNRINKDGSDGYQIASRYIGKYMTKGKFDCESVLDKSAEKPRLCQSVGIGSSLLDKVKNSMLCYDLFGYYDIDTFWCPKLNRKLDLSEIDVLCREIPKRLVYDTGQGYKLPIPRLFRDKVFYHFHNYEAKKTTFSFNSRGGIDSAQCIAPKVLRVSSALWALVSSYIREHLSSYASAKFQQYLKGFDERQIGDACCKFDAYEMGCTEVSENALEANYINFLNSSVF